MDPPKSPTAGNYNTRTPAGAVSVALSVAVRARPGDQSDAWIRQNQS